MTPLHATVRSPELIELDKEIKQNVLNGLKWLRKTYGDEWVEHIDMKKLDLRSGTACVLGQVHPAYYGKHEYDDGYNDATDTLLRGLDGQEYGFNIDWDERLRNSTESEWDLLQKAWEEAIPDEQRRLERLKMSGQTLGQNT